MYEACDFVLDERKFLEVKLIQTLANLNCRLITAIDNLRKKKILETDLAEKSCPADISKNILHQKLIVCVKYVRNIKFFRLKVLCMLKNFKNNRMVNELNNKVCPKCSANNESTRYFCKSCGAFLDTENFDYEAYELPQLKIMRIVDNLRHMQLDEEVPDSAFIPHAERVEKLQALFNLPEFAENKNLGMNMEAFLNLCRHPEFQIAFVGTIKTGKSTLINALLGKNYASMAVTPETAALTKFRVSNPDYVKVTFYTSAEWSELWKSRHNADKFMEEYNELRADDHKSKWIDHVEHYVELTSEEIEDELSKWSSSKSPEHYFVKEIEVGISTLPDDFPPQVVFVDTPGLFDPVAYRSELTKKYIRRANAVFVCVDAQKIQQPEVETIADVFSFSSNNKEKVHIVATHWDKLNKPEKDWAEQKEYLIRQLTGEGFFETKEIAAENIMATAAHIYNLCRDYDKLDDEDDLFDIETFARRFRFDLDSSEGRKKIFDKTNVDTIGEIIKDKLAGNYRQFLLEDIEKKFVGIRHDLQRIADDTKNDAQGLLNDSQKSLEEFKRKAEEKRKDYEKIKNVSEQLNAIIDQVETKTARQMEDICSRLRLKVNPAYTRPTEKTKKGLLRRLADKYL